MKFDSPEGTARTVQVIDERDWGSNHQRFAIGVLVRLADGREVLAIGDSVAIQHDHVMTAIDRRYGEKVKEKLWAGELELDSKTVAPRIVVANETSGYFKKELKIESDVGALQAALAGSAIWKVVPSALQRWGTGPEHLHASMMSRHDRMDTVGSISTVLKAMVSRTESAAELESERKYYSELYKPIFPRLEEYMEALVNDGVIIKIEAKVFTGWLSKFVNGESLKPSRYQWLFDEWGRIDGLVNERQAQPERSVRFIEVGPR